MIEIKNAKEEHYPLIYNSFIRSLWSDLDKRKRKRQHKPPPFFASRTHDVAREILKKCRVIVADFEDLTIGWAAGGGMPPALQFVYVKRDFRRSGFAKRLVQDLVPSGSIPCAHMTTLGKYFLDALGRDYEVLKGAWEEE